MRRSVLRGDDAGLPGRLPDIEQAAVLLAAAAIIAVLVLLVAALLPSERHHAPARPAPSTRIEISGHSPVLRGAARDFAR